jgi:hypothetical protein
VIFSIILEHREYLDVTIIVNGLHRRPQMKGVDHVEVPDIAGGFVGHIDRVI